MSARERERERVFKIRGCERAREREMGIYIWDFWGSEREKGKMGNVEFLIKRLI